jgi:oligopeptide/dipeptide ABC transporter ATP-binding protein
VSLLKVRDLDISFRSTNNPIKVVSCLNFEIKEADVFGLVGESGCGKSLTALSIMGILPRDAFAEGEIIFKGNNLLKLASSSMTSLNPVLTVGYQVAEVLIAHMGLSKKEAMIKTVDLLRAVKIPSPEIRIKEYPHQMSGGMRQRVMIAMAIACNPSLLIADEPTTALDVTIQAQILDLLRSLRQQRNMAILLITHDIGVIAENAKMAAVMYAGRIMEVSQVSNILGNPKHPYTMGLLESMPKTKGIPLKPIAGSVPRPDELPHGCKFSDRCPYVIPDCRKEEPALREIVQGQFARCIRSGGIEWVSSM